MDEQTRNQVDNIFLASLQSSRDESSIEIWNKIENQLDEEDGMMYKTEMRRLIRRTAVVCTFLLGTIVFMILNNSRSTKTKIKNMTSGSTNVSLNAEAKHRESEINNISATRAIYDSAVAPFNNASAHINDLSSEATLISDVSSFAVHPLNIELAGPKTRFIQTQKDDFIFGQDIQHNLIVRPEKRSFKNRLSVTPYFLKEFVGYNLSDDDATASNGQEIENRERNVFSASIGFYLNYRINKRWLLQSGISYSWSSSIIDSSKSFAVNDNSGNVQFKFNTISGYGYLKPLSIVQPVVGDSVFIAKAFSELHYLTVPLILSYKIPLKRFSLLIGAGGSLNLLTGASVETKIYGPNIRENESTIPMKGLKNFNFGILLKAEVEYYINSKWGLDIIPSFKNTLTPINIHSALSAYPYNFGIGAGITYRF